MMPAFVRANLAPGVEPPAPPPGPPPPWMAKRPAGKIADRLAGVFPDFTLEVFEDCHHFEPPHRVKPELLASSLRGLWARAETVSVAG